MRKKNKKALKYIIILLTFAVIAGVIFLCVRSFKTPKPATDTKAPSFAFNFLRDDKQTVEITFGDKVVRMSGAVSDGVYETNGSETTYKHSDGRRTDRYVEGPDKFKHYTYYNSAPAGCSGICSETETYTFENAVLHKNQNGQIKVYYFEDVKLDNANADKNLLDRASRTMTNERLKDIHENGGPDFLLTIPIPLVKDKNNADIPVHYEITGEKYNQLFLTFQAKPDVYPLTLDPTLDTGGSISNESPVITATVSDGGSATSAPTNVGSNVTFTSTAKDVNTDQYYLAVCRTNAITAGNDTAPTCASVPNTWGISSATNSDAQATVTYTTLIGDAESNAWYAFVCDKVASTAVCFPASGSGDQGLAVGTIAFSGVPADTDYITIDSIAYEFDTNSSVTGGRTAVNIATAISGTDVAVALTAVEAGATSHMTNRASVVYVYADTAGASSIGMTENQDTNSRITLSGSALSGGSDNNASPFIVNHAPTFSSVIVSDNNISPAQVLTDGDMEAGNITAWDYGQDATRTKSTSNPHGGSQALRITANSGSGSKSPQSLQQVTGGKTYRITGWARGDGTQIPRVHIGSNYIWSGTSSTEWQYFDTIAMPFSAEPSLALYFTISNPTGVEYVEFDDVMVAEAGTIEPGETLRFTLPKELIADADVVSAQDTINMYICTDATTAFNYSTNSCTGGSLICSDTAVNPTSEDASCDETGNTLVPPTDIHATENFKVYVEDVQNFPGTGTSAQSYTIQNTAPTHDTPELDIHAPVSPNSVGYWQFEDGSSATSFDDETTNSFNGSCSGGVCPTWLQTGYTGGAYDFDGVDDVINAGVMSGTDFSQSYSISLWTRLDTFGDARSNCGSVGFLVTKDSAHTSGFSLQERESKFSFYQGYSDMANWTSFWTTNTYNTGQWYYLTLVHDLQSRSIKLYVNGTQDGSVTYPSDKSLYNSSTSDLRIGGVSSNCSYGYTDGKIDEPHIYSRALSATEIANLYSAYTTPTATSNMDISAKPINIADHDADSTTTIYNWKKNGSSIATLNMPFDSNITSTTTDAVLDYSGNANHGTLGAGTASYVPTWTASGIKGGAYQFDGTDDYLNIAHSSSLSIGNTVSISLWAKRTRLGIDVLLEKGGDWNYAVGGGHSNYGMGLHNANSNMFYFWFYGGWRGTAGVSDYNWHHYAVVAANGTANPTLYIDGTPRTVSYTGGAGTINLNTSGTENLHIGAQVIGSWNYFGANVIDEIRIYKDIALTPEQVVQNYNNGKPLYNTITKSMTSATDTSWVADVTINDAQSVNSNSTTKSTNALGPVNAEPVQGTPSARAHALIDSNSVGYWQFEDGDGMATFDDETTNSNNGSCTNCPAFAEEGGVGGGYDFDGSNDYIEVVSPTNMPTGNNPYTVSLWVNVDDFTKDYGSGNSGIIFSRGSESPQQGHHITTKTDGSLMITHYGPDVDTGWNFTANTWYHIVDVWDGSVEKLYINGAIENPSLHTTALNIANTNLKIGRHANVASYYFNGIIDEPHIYNRALSATEIKNLYNSNSYVYGTMDLGASARSLSDPDSDATYITTDWRKNGTSAAVLNMSFNKNVTSTTAGAVTDYSSYGNNGQLGGGTASYVPTWTNASTCGNNTGGCYSFDGSNDQIWLTSPLPGIESSDYTIGAWIKKSTGTGGDNDSIFSQASDSNHEFRLELEATTCRLIIVTYEGGYGNVIGTTNLCDGNWHYVVAAKSGTTGTLYVDGSQQNTGTVRNVTTTDRASIGVIRNSVTTTYYFGGYIDEVQVYNRVLTAGQITAIYNAGKPNFQNLAYGELSIGDLWKANVTAFDANGNEDGTIVTNELEVLGFSAGPSDGSSSATTPTTAGNNVTFTATYNAPSSRQWYLAICKTNEVTAGNDAAPTCATDQTWVISSAATDAAQATATYTTSSGDATTNVWYAFACEKLATTATCSPASQGTGNTGSPFVVNHIAALGTVKIGSECGDTAPTAPGNAKTMKITNGVWSGEDNPYSTVIQNDGKIIVAGDSSNGSNLDFAVARYNTDGSLDTTFGTGGKVTTAIGSGDDLIRSVAIQSDGKIVVAGDSHNGSNNDFAVARYNTDGSLDTGFDSDGKVTTAIGSNHDNGYSVAIQSDGKIVVGGYTADGSNTLFALTRYNTNGSLDTDFDSDGKVITTIIGNDWLNSVAIQSDGKIIAAGSIYIGGYSDFAVVRYNADGSLDTSFDTDGKATTPVLSGNDWAAAVDIQSDGKIVLAGEASSATVRDFAIVRFNTDGSLDTSFSGDGIVTTTLSSGWDGANSVVIQGDGKIVAGGWSKPNSYYAYGIARYNTDGSLDTAFASTGYTSISIAEGHDWAQGIAIQNDGKIIAGGISYFTLNTGYDTAKADMSVIRFNVNGSLDATFDHDGKVTTAVWSADDEAVDIDIQSDGKIVTGGYTQNGTDYDFAVTRYNADGTLDISFDSDGKVTTSLGSAYDFIYSLKIQNDGKIVAGGAIYNGSYDDIVVVRYNANGSLDTSFDTDGKVITPTGSGDSEIYAIDIQSDGKIIGAGSSYNGSNYDFTILRYNSDGTLDTSFDTDGKAIIDIQGTSDWANGVIIQSDGKIVVSGQSSNGSNYDFAVIRLNSNGSLDTGFDTDGKVTTPIGSGYDSGVSVGLQSDGKIVVVGQSNNGTYKDFAIVRYTTAGALDTGFDSDGIVTTSLGTGNDSANTLAIQTDGKIVAYGVADNGSGNDFALARYNSNGSLDSSFGTGGIVINSLGSTSDWGSSIALQNDGKLVTTGGSYYGTNQDFALVRYNTNGSVDSPTDYMCVQGAITDADTTDTVDMYVCSTNSFTAGETPACGATELCKITGVKSGGNAQCLVEDLIDVPTAHGSGNVYVFIVDSNGLQGTGTSTQSYSVADVSPKLVSYTASDSPAPTAGGSDTVGYSVSLTDDNGDNDVTNVKGTFFDSAVTNNYCSANENNCYIHSSCTLTGVGSGTDNALGANCQAVVWYNANASTSWKVQAKATDGMGNIDFADLGSAITNPALQGLDVVQGSLAYGAVALGRVSARQQSAVGNMGNQVIDLMIDGDSMCTDYPTCAGSQIALGQQKWYHTDTDFNWAATPTNPGPYTLVDTANTGCTSGVDCGDTHGCLNRNIPVRTDHTSASTNESVWWKLKIPEIQAIGAYTGKVVFGTTSSSTCAAGQSY